MGGFDECTEQATTKMAASDIVLIGLCKSFQLSPGAFFGFVPVENNPWKSKINLEVQH
jgi:hypothetical protein